MPLSEHEQKMLDQMEQALLAEDPRFASSMQGQAERRAQRNRWILGGVGVLAGLGLVLLGVNTQIWVGALGFAAMVASAAYALSTPRKPKLGVARPDGSVRHPMTKRPTKGRGRPNQSFTARMEERWERRRERGNGW
ncbi:DUF3040 domain-containing protein [Janibacter sp. G1551]|uniref:DUF3040 domain-containing protein n=1 Tax=Janibacter sp. G1551 TaxID=3420440 RepID=UPI003D07B14C